MSAIRIDGKKISEEVGQRLFLELQERKLVGKVSLGILCVGNDPASLTFINVKKKFGEKYGFVVNILKLEDGASVAEIKDKLQAMQSKNNAVIVQLPLPKNLLGNTDEILKDIFPEKDVDNLNNGKYTAPIVLALEKVLNEVDHNLSEKVFGIVGLGQVVGLPIYNYLVENKYNVVKIGRDNFNEIKNCDVVISGVGVPHLIKQEEIKEASVLVDYGCSCADLNGEQKMCGDFAEECYLKSSFYTPVPGCMGPLVVACLFENLLKSVQD